jgi:hypothetical protein
MNSAWILAARRRAVTVAAVAAAAVVAVAVPASAHTPVILTDQDRVPWLAPLAADGTDPFGFYGVANYADDERAVQIELKAGDTLNETLLVPDQAPENALTANQLPTLLLISPEFTVTTVNPTLHIPVTDPDSGHGFIVLGSYKATVSTAGTYTLMVVGHTTERFVVSSGTESENFHGLLRGSVATDAEVDTWYNTPAKPCIMRRGTVHAY